MIQKSRLDSEESMRKEIEIMNGFGSRATGLKGHQEFIAWLKQQLEDMGLPIYSDTYPFERWEEKRSALTVFKGTSQATSTWLMGHPELWDGKNGNKKAVAGITVEHLGSMEWKEHGNGQYKATGNIQTECTYVGNARMGKIWGKPASV
jgi:hypothetical protein